MGVVAAPAADQIEISIFGPGYGECTLVHIGSGHWIIIDSCVDGDTQAPVSLEYLRSMGVTTTSVKLIIATHWHDDHIRGLSKVVAECADARICLSSALSQTEVIATIVAYDQRSGVISGSGASEMVAILNTLRKRKTPAVRAFANKLVLKVPASDLAHDQECSVFSLSPSDAQFELFLSDFGSWAPVPKETKRRVPEQSPNHLSVVTWIAIGDLYFLMGADLEEPGNPHLGWSAIVSMHGRPQGKASFFKIPHHGSVTANHGRTWTELLQPNPMSVLTPWNRGSGLPSAGDVIRLCSQTNSGFSTSSGTSRHAIRRSTPIEKQIRETVGNLRNTVGPTGHVRLRNGGRDKMNMWCVELLRGSCPLNSLLASSAA